MKKLIILLVFLFAVIGLQAQGDFGLSTNATYREYTGTAADTVTGATTLTKTVKIDKGYLYYYDVLVDIDTVSGGGDNPVSCILSGSNDNTTYTTISDVTFAASADTVFSYTNIGARFTETIGAVTIAAHDESRRGTSSIAAHIITASDSIIYSDTLNVAQQVTTYTDTIGVAAQTITSAGNTVVEGGVMWRFLKLTLTGDGASAAVELQAIKVKVVKIP